ncbi:hypothetical protein P4640_27240 [Priestia aryabhattai]|uniref:hypothetical protein n=1 Tax=Priestia aryabhattai TaxID=412384 RepID=UPI002E1EB0BB|nr:hypothetical protein [Priestia aryabhattai]
MLNDWREDIREGNTMIFDISYEIHTDLLEYLAGNQDKLAVETLRQRENGMPQDIHDKIFSNIPYSEEIWKSYGDDKVSRIIEDPMRKRDYKNVIVDGYDYFRAQDKHYCVLATDKNDIISKGLRLTGSRTVTQTVSDSNETQYFTGKGKIYAL